jgi:cytochrome b involved in lipid metabolism
MLIARYGKRFSLSYKVHGVIMTFFLIANLILFGVQFTNSGMTNEKGNLRKRGRAKGGWPGYLYHWYAITSVFTCCIVLGATGTLLESLYLSRGTKKSTWKPYLRRFHMIVGIIAWASGKGAIYVMGGIPKVNIFYYGMPALSILIVCVMESMNFFKKDKKVKPPSREDLKKIKRDQHLIVKKLQQGATSTQMKADFPSKVIMIFKHKIYDVTDYHHPGGEIIFRNHNFHEISRYMIGTHPDEYLNFETWKHSLSAFKALESRYIGSLIEGELLPQVNEFASYGDNSLIGLDDASFASLGLGEETATSSIQGKPKISISLQNQFFPSKKFSF